MAMLFRKRKEKKWWRQVTAPVPLVFFFVAVLGFSLFILGTRTEPSSQQEQDREISAAKQSRRNPELEQEYRVRIGPAVSSYLKARSVYQGQATQEGYQKWLALAQETEEALMRQRVPAYYQEFHLGAVVALSLEKSGLRDIVGNPSDSGSVNESLSLKERGEEKLRSAEEYWKKILQGQEEWLRL